MVFLLSFHSRTQACVCVCEARWSLTLTDTLVPWLTVNGFGH